MKKYLNSNLYILYDDLKGYLLKRFDRSLFLSRTHIRSILYEKRKKGNDGRKSDRKCSWLISDGTMFRFMFRCLSISFREPTCLGADQKARGLWERDWMLIFKEKDLCKGSLICLFISAPKQKPLRALIRGALRNQTHT